MKTLLIATLLLTTATAGVAAAAQPAGRLSDSQFVKAARCKGLAKATQLGPYDASALIALVKVNKPGRADFIMQRADVAQIDAQSEASHAKEARKAELIAERDGACAAFAS